MPGVSQSEALATIDADLREYVDQRIFSRNLYIHDIYQFFSEHELVQLATVDTMNWHGLSGVVDLEVADGEVIVPGTISITAVEAL
jgi:hypothetical protein